jgi:hypothetical protein
MSLKAAERRKQAYDEARADAERLLSDRRIRDFVVLYLAEGYKKNRNKVSLSNANPRIVAFAHDCMRPLASRDALTYSFQYHADQDPEQLRRFWVGVLSIAPEQIKPIPKTNSGHLKGRRFACEYGVFEIVACDTMFRARLQALMDVVQDQWGQLAEIR